MDQDVGASGEPDELVGPGRVPGDDDRAVGRVEAVGERRGPTGRWWTSAAVTFTFSSCIARPPFLSS
jgi:hypothetical protein